MGSRLSALRHFCAISRSLVNRNHKLCFRVLGSIMPAIQSMKERFSPSFNVGKRKVGANAPAYFIAEIGANFDGSLEKAKEYARIAKECGADCAKIQSFKSKKIVSGKGFASMKLKGVHGSWRRPVDEVFKEVEFPRGWHQEFFEYCWKIGITPC